MASNELLIKKDINMFWDKERAVEAYNRVPNKNLNEEMAGDQRTFDKSVWKELRKINEQLEELIQEIKK